MRRVLICAMVLGLLPSLAFAQRGRMAGGMGPTSRTAFPTTVGPMSSTSRMNTSPGLSNSEPRHSCSQYQASGNDHNGCSQYGR